MILVLLFLVAKKMGGEKMQENENLAVDNPQGENGLENLISKITNDILENDPEIVAMKEQLKMFQQKDIEGSVQKDFEKIKNLYPDEKAENILDLGDDFMNMIFEKTIDPIVAYEACRLAKTKKENPPPSMGAICDNNNSDQLYFSKEQVAGMTQREVKKHFEKIKKSMKKW